MDAPLIGPHAAWLAATLRRLASVLRGADVTAPQTCVAVGARARTNDVGLDGTGKYEERSRDVNRTRGLLEGAPQAKGHVRYTCVRIQGAGTVSAQEQVHQRNSVGCSVREGESELVDGTNGYKTRATRLDTSPPRRQSGDSGMGRESMSTQTLPLWTTERLERGQALADGEGVVRTEYTTHGSSAGQCEQRPRDMALLLECGRRQEEESFETVLGSGASAIARPSNEISKRTPRNVEPQKQRYRI
ncbi:hypothetical protein B0H10DRAFT_1948057 [Mycena sp. CBHHK59/15]|nr:hypothetical protein B0H10DRAFT_1948057 [Mycena sp. CBHHK59/15]